MYKTIESGFNLRFNKRPLVSKEPRLHVEQAKKQPFIIKYWLRGWTKSNAICNSADNFHGSNSVPQNENNSTKTVKF